MLTLTPAASAAVETILNSTDAPDGAGLRLERGADPAGNPAIGISVAPGPEPDDAILHASGAADVFLSADVAELLGDQILDAEIEDQGVAFMIRPQPTNGHLDLA